MKKYLVFAALFLVSLQIFAQEEFAPIGAEWVINGPINFLGGQSHLARYTSIKSTGDTLVNGQVLRKVGHYLVKQEGSKVYISYQDTLRLAYDFGLSVGDTAQFSFPAGPELWTANYVLDTITQVTTANGVVLNKFWFKVVEDWWGIGPYTYDYIDRIGSEEDFWVNPLPIAGGVGSFLRCYKDSTLDFVSKTFLHYSQNSSDCYLIVSGTEEPNLYGLELSPNPARGQFQLRLADSDLQGGTLRVYSSTGQLYYAAELRQTLSVLEVPTTNWCPDNYVIRFIARDGRCAVRKLVVSGE